MEAAPSGWDDRVRLAGDHSHPSNSARDTCRSGFRLEPLYNRGQGRGYVRPHRVWAGGNNPRACHGEIGSLTEIIRDSASLGNGGEQVWELLKWNSDSDKAKVLAMCNEYGKDEIEEES